MDLIALAVLKLRKRENSTGADLLLLCFQQIFVF